MDIGKYKRFAKDKLGVNFQDIELLITALTHRSYLNEHKKTVKEHNERMEFLGDAVLELATTEYLYQNYKEPEGVLTSWRSALVRTESISQAADKLDLEPLLRLSRGEKRGSQRARQQILANAYEAVVGAIYLDQGYEPVREFIDRSLLSTFPEILRSGSWLDPKSRLQEIAQNKDGHTPHYRVLREEGPDHEKQFKVGVFVGGKLKGQGKGHSKQIAQQQAAQKALREYN